METIQPIVNRVAQSGLITLDLEEYFPKPEEIEAIDLKEFLFKGLILREAEFREMVKNTDWKKFENKYVVLYCSTNAIIPMWAYMVLSAELTAYVKDVVSSSLDHAAEIFLYRNLAKLNEEEFKGARVVVKGCGERQIPEAAYVQIAFQLTKVAKSVMFGEACSAVPVYKKTNK
jgi:hypothetical protein